MLELHLSLTTSHRCLPRPGAPGWWLGIRQAVQAPKQAALEGPLSCGHSFWVVLSSLWMIIGLLRHKDGHQKDRLGKDQNKAGIKTGIKQLNKELSGNRLDRFNADSGLSKRQSRNSILPAAQQPREGAIQNTELKWYCVECRFDALSEFRGLSMLGVQPFIKQVFYMLNLGGRLQSSHCELVQSIRNLKN